MKKYLFILPLILATSFAYAGWKSKPTIVEDASVIDTSPNDEDRSAFIDLSKMVAAGDLEGAQNQVIEAATDQGVGFTQTFFREILPNGRD